MVLLLACAQPPAPAPPPPLTTPAALTEVAPGAWLATGYGLANVAVLEGPDGLVIVDTMEGRTPATEVLAAIRTRTAAPIAAVVLTHSHPDHAFGGQVFTGGAEVPVWAHARADAELNQLVTVMREALTVRSVRMFGAALPRDELDAGIGPGLRFSEPDIALAWPTHHVDSRTPVRLGGLDLELIPIPGETEDQLAVWWPERRVLVPGDDIYAAFPNLTTIRGTRYRDVRAWFESLDTMRDLGAEVLLPMHTVPIVGAAEVDATLTAYRDAIQFVHDQTIRRLNRGETPDEIAAGLRLPPHLAAHPWLQERYGTVAWSARGIYAGTLGWFDGDGSRLEPLPPEERARRYADAFAAGTPLPDQARAAVAAGDWAWAAEVARLWTQAEPDSADARATLAAALEGRAAGHPNPNARHWYLTQAGELRGDLQLVVPPPGASPVDLVDALPIEAFLRAMTTRLRAEAALEADRVVVFELTDEGRTFTLHIRRGVAELRERVPPREDVRLRTTARAWKRIVTGRLGAAEAVATGQLAVEGGPAAVVDFLVLFERP